MGRLANLLRFALNCNLSLRVGLNLGIFNVRYNCFWLEQLVGMYVIHKLNLVRVDMYTKSDMECNSEFILTS